MFRTILRVSGYLAGGMALVGAAFFALLYFAFQPSRDEVAAVSSPDGQLVAKLIEVNGGATTSFGYSIVVAESGSPRKSEEVAYLYGAVRNASAYGANLRWASPSELAVEFLEARSAELVGATPKLAGREVTVVLRANVLDASAPSGGMLYNLRGRHE